MKTNRIITPKDTTQPPDQNEKEVARTFAKKYKKDIEFLTPSYGYRSRTPDFTMGGQRWEIKTPLTNNEDRLKEILRKAKHQSENIVIYGKFLKKTDDSMIKILT